MTYAYAWYELIGFMILAGLVIFLACRGLDLLLERFLDRRRNRREREWDREMDKEFPPRG